MSKQFIFQQASLLQAPCSALQARVRSAACRFHSNLKADATPSGLKKVNTKQLKSGVVPPSLEWDTIPDPTAFQTPLYSGPHCILDPTAFRTPLHSGPHCIPYPTAFQAPLHFGPHCIPDTTTVDSLYIVNRLIFGIQPNFQQTEEGENAQVAYFLSTEVWPTNVLVEHRILELVPHLLL